ncbi:Protein FAR1-RELATED SEQUENCE like, partial [Actinidia chinensis var. chinensis]
VMAEKKVIAIIQSGGEFETNQDGSLSYRGGDAHAREIDGKTKYTDFKVEVAEMFNSNLGSVSIKYFLPGNKKTLITISNDKDLECMINFHDDSVTANIYVMTEEEVATQGSDMPASRSSRTTLSEAGVLVDDPLNVTDDVVDDTTRLVILDDTIHVDARIVIPTDIPLSFPCVGSNYENIEKHIKAPKEWKSNITGVGQRFNSVHEFREALRKYAVAHQFVFKYVKNDCHRVTVTCKAEGCPWIIHARKLSNTQVFRIRKMNATHTCEGTTMTTGYLASKNLVASIIKEKVKVQPNYRPKDILNDIKQEYGIELKYYHAWAGKEIAKEQLHGSCKDAYNQLPFLCEKIMKTNPGSLATLITKEDLSFHRLFVSFHASLFGFLQGCRPLLFLDSTPLKSKYQGTLLKATAADGDDGVFPVAFAIIDAETDDHWHWFLVQLKSAFSTAQSITFVADREKGLRDSIAYVFHDLNVHHGYCLRYLSEQLVRELKGQYSDEAKRLMVEDFYAAAYEPKPVGFQRCVENIKSISLEAYNWVMQSEPVHWANAFFQGARYNHMTSNFGDQFYSWASEAHDVPITLMVDAIQSKLMELIYTRQADSNQWRTRLTPSMEEKLEKENQKFFSLRVAKSAGNKFEVCGDSFEVVDLDHRDCSCKGWQLTGLPCCHAIAVMNCIDCSPYAYCSRYFTTDSYRLTYSESINPVSTVDGLVRKESMVTVTPPSTRRRPGRPPVKPLGPQDLPRRKRKPKCSRCKVIGHKKSTCKELLFEC